MLKNIFNKIITFIFPFTFIPPFAEYANGLTWFDIVNTGWKYKIFFPFCCEMWWLLLRNEGISGLKKYDIIDIKEKWGHMEITSDLTVFPFKLAVKIVQLETKYALKSYLYCINCGKKSTYRTIGYVRYYCNDCAQKHSHKIKLTKEDINEIKHRKSFNIPFQGN